MRAQVVRVSSALDLDLTPVVEETARLVLEAVRGAVGQAVAEQTMPALAQLIATIQELDRRWSEDPSAVLGEQDMLATLTGALPVGFLSGAANALQVAQFQAERLTEAGYALVSVGEHKRQLSPLTPLDQRYAEMARERAALESQGIGLPSLPPDAPVPGPSLVDRGIARPDSLADWPGALKEPTAEQRADARLDQARQNGIEDSWHEEHDR